MFRSAALPGACLLVLGAACGHAPPPSPPPPSPPPPAGQTAALPGMLEALFSSGRLSVALDELAQRAPLAEGETFKIVEIGRDAHSSHHVVSLRAAEPLHRHDRHDLLVVTLKGEGRMLLGETEQAIAAPSIVYVPRGTVHSMRPASAEPVTGYAVFVPPFDGQDRALIESAPPSPSSPP